MSNQTSSSDKLKNTSQKLEASKPLDKKKDEYIKDIRSQKRKDHLKDKRLTAVNSLSDQLDHVNLQEDTLGQGLSLQEFLADCHSRTYTLEQINELVASLSSPNLYRQLFGVIGTRKLVSIETNPPIQLFIDAGAIPPLIELLSREDEHQLQLEAAWALSNLVSGTTQQTQKVVNSGVIPELVKLLSSPHKDVNAQTIWTLGNVAGDHVTLRDAVLQGGTVAPLVRALEEAIEERNEKILKHGTWALSNLYRGKPKPPYQGIKDALPILAQVIMTQGNPEILVDAFWCMAFLSDRKQDRIQGVLDTGVVPYVVKHMTKTNFSMLSQCMKIIGNICAGSREQIDMLLKTTEIMEKLFDALFCEKKGIRKEALWVLSEIAAGTPDHIEYIVGNAELLRQFFLVGSNDAPDVQKEVAWTFNNALGNANKEQLRILFESRVLEFFGSLIEDVSLQGSGLEGIWKILNLEADRAPEGFTRGACWSLLKSQENVLLRIEELKGSSSSQVAELAVKILEAGGEGK